MEYNAEEGIRRLGTLIKNAEGGLEAVQEGIRDIAVRCSPERSRVAHRFIVELEHMKRFLPGCAVVFLAADIADPAELHGDEPGRTPPPVIAGGAMTFGESQVTPTVSVFGKGRTGGGSSPDDTGHKADPERKRHDDPRD